MKLSTSMWSMDRTVQSEGLTQKDFINWASRAGLKYIELLSYYMDKENNLKDIIDLLKLKNIEVSCYTILSDFSTEKPDYNKLIEDMETAKHLKTPFIRILGGDSNTCENDARKNIATGISKAAAEAESRGLTLILENIGPYSCHSDQMLYFMENCTHTHLRLNFDTANPLLADEDPTEALRNQLPWISYVHIKDFITEDDPSYASVSKADPGRIQNSTAGKLMTGITAGKGSIPLKGMLSLLTSNGYDGFLSIEYEGTGDSVKDTKESLNYLRALL